MNRLPGVLFITSYPPRECGIATFSQDLIKALNKTFSQTFTINVCALEARKDEHAYPEEVKYILHTSRNEAYVKLAREINADPEVNLVVVEHEFGLFYRYERSFQQFLFALDKPVIMSFHTVTSAPNRALKRKVQGLVSACECAIVMTKSSAKILTRDYDLPKQKVKVIPHGTHLLRRADKNKLKEKYGVTSKKILSTYGLLSRWKGIELTLEALPDIVREHPDVLFLVIGKTHPEVVKREGEKYRNMLKTKIQSLNLQKHVRFINEYLPLSDLLEYLQLTDVYLFTSKNPEQAVSGTFTYAMSCGCPIVSTRIPHAEEVLKEGGGLLIDFNDSRQLATAVNTLLGDDQQRVVTGLKALYTIVPTAWENAAVAHARLFRQVLESQTPMTYNLPDINLSHIHHLTTDFGILQFAKIDQPDIQSGYALDDNAMALIALIRHYELTGADSDIDYIYRYLNFIKYCLQPDGSFLNYVDYHRNFTEENDAVNLEDANGRAVWALGVLISNKKILPEALVVDAEAVLQEVLPNIERWHSPRAMAFSIKGLHVYNNPKRHPIVTSIIEKLADRLVSMYQKETERKWTWFESCLTYANSILPEALLCAYKEKDKSLYKDVAEASFRFLLDKTFEEDYIRVISNKSWLYKGEESFPYGEQPIDAAYTVLALSRFYDVFEDPEYLYRMNIAFSWFLGNNHLGQIVYNPCTGGCYDGLEESYVNLNQGAESIVSYLMARLEMEQYSNLQVEGMGISSKTHNVIDSQLKPLE